MIDSLPEGDLGISFDPVTKRVNIATEAIRLQRGTPGEWLTLVMDIGSELNRVLRNRYPKPVWDAWHNRSHEPVEVMAKEIYDAGDEIEILQNFKKPAWVPGGNSEKQDEARALARRKLREAGHVGSQEE